MQIQKHPHEETLREMIEEKRPCYIDPFGTISPHWLEAVFGVVYDYFKNRCNEYLLKFSDDDWAVCAEEGLTLNEVCDLCGEYRYQEQISTLEEFFYGIAWTADLSMSDAIECVKDFYVWRNERLPAIKEIIKKEGKAE